MDSSFWRIVLFVCGFFGMSWIVLASNWLSARGLEVSATACAWDPAQSAYVATVTVRNTEEKFKVAELSVQGRFRPGEGRDWPHHTIRTRYSSVTQPLVVALGPQETATEQVAYTIPSAEAFECSANVRIGRQEKFDQEPSSEVLDAVTGELGQRTPSARRGFRRRGL